MKQLYLPLIVIFSLLLGCSTSSSNFRSIYIADLEHNQAEYLANFREINNIVKRKHSHLRHKGILLDSIFSVYAVQVEKAETKEEFGALLLKYFAALQNGHTDVYLSRDFIIASASLIENRLFISGLADQRLSDQGVLAKDEIIGIDGIPVLEWLEREKVYVGGSTEQGRMTRAVSGSVFASYFGGERHYQIKTADGLKEVRVAFEKQSYTSGDKSILVSSRSISDSIGYIAINSMGGNVVAEFLEQYKQLKDKPNLIIDLRRNGGGNSGLGEAMATCLIKQEQKASVSRRTLKPATDNYQGRLYLLTSGRTFSSAESFVIDLKEAGAATIVGEPTGGDTGNGATAFSTRQGIAFRIPTRQPRFSAGGFPMEGTSIQPTHLVTQKVEDFLNGRDTVLNFTIGLINSEGKSL